MAARYAVGVEISIPGDESALASPSKSRGRAGASERIQDVVGVWLELAGQPNSKAAFKLEMRDLILLSFWSGLVESLDCEKFVVLNGARAMFDQLPAVIEKIPEWFKAAQSVWPIARASAPWITGRGNIKRFEEFDEFARKEMVDVLMTGLKELHKQRIAAVSDLANDPWDVLKQQKLELLESEERLALKKLEGIRYYAEQQLCPESGDDTKPIEEDWVDVFNSHARRRTSPFRSQLLSRALAHEAAKPGSISLKTLWFIGTMDEALFDALAMIFNSGYDETNLCSGEKRFVFPYTVTYLKSQGGFAERGVKLSEIKPRLDAENLLRPLDNLAPDSPGLAVAEIGSSKFFQFFTEGADRVNSRLSYEPPKGFALYPVAQELIKLCDRAPESAAIDDMHRSFGWTPWNAGCNPVYEVADKQIAAMEATQRGGTKVRYANFASMRWLLEEQYKIPDHQVDNALTASLHDRLTAIKAAIDLQDVPLPGVRGFGDGFKGFGGRRYFE